MKNKLKNEQTIGFHRLKKIKKRAGATLVEALLALAIFSVFTIGSTQLIFMHRKTMDMASDYYTAANIAKNRLEFARTFDSSKLLKLNEVSLRIDASGNPLTEGHFCRTTTIGPLNNGVYQLTVTVKVMDRKTLSFDGPGQTLTSYIR